MFLNVGMVHIQAPGMNVRAAWHHYGSKQWLGGDPMSNDAFRRQLLQQRNALLRQVTNAEDDPHSLDANVEAERMDEGQEQSLALVLERLDTRGKVEIEAIDRALARIAGGTFGTCTGCGGPIPKTRLAALPRAERCLSCAKVSEHVA
jgi:RNA polymerase-binding transcription factor DksA